MLYQLSYEATHWERGQFIEFISIYFFQASSFQLLKLENLLRWSSFTFRIHSVAEWESKSFCILKPRSVTLPRQMAPIFLGNHCLAQCEYLLHGPHDRVKCMKRRHWVWSHTRLRLLPWYDVCNHSIVLPEHQDYLVSQRIFQSNQWSPWPWDNIFKNNLGKRFEFEVLTAKQWTKTILLIVILPRLKKLKRLYQMKY